jgi:hypothetical protein
MGNNRTGSTWKKAKVSKWWRTFHLDHSVGANQCIEMEKWPDQSAEWKAWLKYKFANSHLA